MVSLKIFLDEIMLLYEMLNKDANSIFFFVYQINSDQVGRGICRFKALKYQEWKNKAGIIDLF